MNRLVRWAIALAVTAVVAPSAAHAAEAPKFKHFPAGVVLHEATGKLDLSSKGAKAFRTRLQQAAKLAPNFAGHYVLTTWGCGGACVTGALIDASTGKVTFLPTVSGWGAVDEGFEPVVKRLDSRLLVLAGQIDEAGAMGAHFYDVKKGKLVHVTTIETSDDFQTATP